MAVVYGGTQVDTSNLLANEAVRGKIVLMRPFTPPPGFDGRALSQSSAFRAYQASLAGAIVVGIVSAVP